MKKYYFHVADMQHGPYALDELISKGITKNTPVWYEGLSEWTPASQLGELRDLFPPTPPPFETATSKAGKAVGRGIWQLIRLAAIIILCVVGIRLFVQWRAGQHGAPVSSLLNTEKDLVRNNISTFVTVGHSSYHYSTLGGINGLSIIVNNSSDYMLEHVKVKLSYIKVDGGLWKDVILDFNYIPGHKQQTLPVTDTDRGVKVTEQIMKIESSELGLE